jgi:hypothetical protein
MDYYSNDIEDYSNIDSREQVKYLENTLSVYSKNINKKSQIITETTIEHLMKL